MDAVARLSLSSTMIGFIHPLPSGGALMLTQPTVKRSLSIAAIITSDYGDVVATVKLGQEGERWGNKKYLLRQDCGNLTAI